jgi:hypothetical protein
VDVPFLVDSSSSSGGGGQKEQLHLLLRTDSNRARQHDGRGKEGFTWGVKTASKI